MRKNFKCSEKIPRPAQVVSIFDTSFGPKEILINATTNRSAIFGCYVYYADWLNNSGETMEIL
jgi:hypothetical protein